MTAQPPDEPQAGSQFYPPTQSGNPSDPPNPPAAPFDPYRFGPPTHPVDPAYAPPGYVPPPAQPSLPPAGGYGAQQFPAGPGSDPSGYSQPGQYVAPGQSPYGQPPAAQPQYGQPPYGQAPYGQPQYGGQPPYGQAPYGQPQYGQAPYGQPQYGYGAPVNPYGPTKVTNGLAVTALVLGIIALVFCWVPFFDGLIIVPGIVFAIIGINAAKRRGGVGKTLAIVGLCLSLVATVGCIAISVWVVTRINCSTVEDGFGDHSTHCTVDNNED